MRYPAARNCAKVGSCQSFGPPVQGAKGKRSPALLGVFHDAFTGLHRVVRAEGVEGVHMRNEADHMAEALEEVIHIGRETGIRILVTHFKLRGRRNWGNARRHLDTIDRARGEGIDIGIAQYPYTANSPLTVRVSKLSFR